jgi:septation ring formation regulator EzrA
MTPQEKNVFSKLFSKTELGTHKVDLGLIDDLKALISGTDQGANYYSDVKTALNNVMKVAQQSEMKLNSEISNINSLLGKIESQAKDLGLDINQQADYKRALSVIKDYKNRIDVINQIISNIKKFGF